MKKNKLARALLFLAAAIVLFAVSRADVNPKFSGFAFGASIPMILAAIIGFVLYFKEPKAQA